MPPATGAVDIELGLLTYMDNLRQLVGIVGAGCFSRFFIAVRRPGFTAAVIRFTDCGLRLTAVTAMVGNVKPRSFENDGYRSENTLGVTAAFGAGNGTVFTETSYYLKSVGATRAFVFVDWQT